MISCRSLLAKRGHQTTDLVGHAGVKQGLAHHKHPHAEDYIGIDIPFEGLRRGENPGQTEPD